MVVRCAADASFDGVSDLGLAIREIRPGQNHCAILYKLDGRSARVCHLANHHDLRDEIARDPYLWANAGLDPANRRFVAAWVGNLHVNKDNIPYGLDSAGCCFDLATGEFIAPPIGKGLTCSTFITTVLRSLGFDLLREGEWPQRVEDAAFGQGVLEMLAVANADDEHIKAVAGDIGAQRFRPEEVVGAATLTIWPVPYADARTVADAVVQDLNGARFTEVGEVCPELNGYVQRQSDKP
jgi:hypothetical protein